MISLPLKIASFLCALAPVVIVLLLAPPTHTTVPPLAQPSVTPVVVKRVPTVKWQEVGPLQRDKKFRTNYITHDPQPGEVDCMGTFVPFGPGPDGSTQYSNGNVIVVFSGFGNDGWHIWRKTENGDFLHLYNAPIETIFFPTSGWVSLNGTVPAPTFEGAYYE